MLGDFGDYGEHKFGEHWRLLEGLDVVDQQTVSRLQSLVRSGAGIIARCELEVILLHKKIEKARADARKAGIEEAAKHIESRTFLMPRKYCKKFCAQIAEVIEEIRALADKPSQEGN